MLKQSISVPSRPKCRAGGVIIDLMRPGPVAAERIHDVLTQAKELFWARGNAARTAPGKLRLLQVIASHLREGRWPGMAAIARDAGLSLRTAWRRYRDLIDEGWIEKIRRFSIASDGTTRKQETNAVRIKTPVEPKQWPTEDESDDFIPQWPPPADGIGEPEEPPEITDELVDPYLCQIGTADSLNSNMNPKSDQPVDVSKLDVDKEKPPGRANHPGAIRSQKFDRISRASREAECSHRRMPEAWPEGQDSSASNQCRALGDWKRYHN